MSSEFDVKKNRNAFFLHPFFRSQKTEKNAKHTHTNIIRKHKHTAKTQRIENHSNLFIEAGSIGFKVSGLLFGALRALFGWICLGGPLKTGDAIKNPRGGRQIKNPGGRTPWLRWGW